LRFAERRKAMVEEFREKVRERYADVAWTVREANGGESTSYCGSSCCESEQQALEVDMTGGSYSETEKRELPQLAADASRGCGNPVALASLSPGEVVLDLGSGGGIDVLLSARRVTLPVENRMGWI
jgi:arsenite methyltransferase